MDQKHFYFYDPGEGKESARVLVFENPLDYYNDPKKARYKVIGEDEYYELADYAQFLQRDEEGNPTKQYIDINKTTIDPAFATWDPVQKEYTQTRRQQKEQIAHVKELSLPYRLKSISEFAFICMIQNKYKISMPVILSRLALAEEVKKIEQGDLTLEGSKVNQYVKVMGSTYDKTKEELLEFSRFFEKVGCATDYALVYATEYYDKAQPLTIAQAAKVFARCPVTIDTACDNILKLYEEKLQAIASDEQSHITEPQAEATVEEDLDEIIKRAKPEYTIVYGQEEEQEEE